MPLNKLVKGKPRGKALLVVRNENAIGFAIDLISFDKRYEAAFWYVFGDTIVVDSLNTARSLMGGVRLVTLDGELIESSGAITGGSLPEKSLFGIGDAKKIAELNERLREAGNEQEILTKKLMEIKDELGKIEEELRDISPIENEKLERMEIRKREIESKLKLITNELNKKEEEWKKIEEDFSQLEEKIRGKEKEIELSCNFDLEGSHSSYYISLMKEGIEREELVVEETTIIKGEKGVGKFLPDGKEEGHYAVGRWQTCLCIYGHEETHTLLGRAYRFLSSFRFYQFIPSEIRETSVVRGELELERSGANLARVLHTLHSQQEEVFQRIEDLLRQGIPEIEKLRTPVSYTHLTLPTKA